MRLARKFPLFPVEPGNFVDFPHAPAVWRQKSKANQALRTLSLGMRTGNSCRPNREITAEILGQATAVAPTWIESTDQILARKLAFCEAVQPRNRSPASGCR